MTVAGGVVQNRVFASQHRDVPGILVGSMNADSQRTKALSVLTLIAVVWGFSFPVQKAIASIHEGLLPGGGSWLTTAWLVAPRFAIAGVILAVMLGRKLGGLTRLELKQGSALGFFLTLGLFFQVDGLQHTSASVSAFFTQAYVVMIPLYLAVKWHRRPRLIVLAACALVIAGIALLARINLSDLRLGRGEAETLLSSLFFMGQILWLERPEFGGNDSSRTTLVMFFWLALAGTVASLALAPRAGDLLVTWMHPGWLGLTLVLALVCTLYCFAAMNRWQPQITSTEAALIYSLEPVSVAVLALFLPGVISHLTGAVYANEVVTWQMVAGGVLITAANLMIAFRKPRPPPPGESAI